MTGLLYAPKNLLTLLCQGIFVAALALLVLLDDLPSLSPIKAAASTTAQVVHQAADAIGADAELSFSGSAPSGKAGATSETSATTLSSVTDVAGDLPELLLPTAAPVLAARTVYRQVGFKLGVLPHPFPERPQRPPRGTRTFA